MAREIETANVEELSVDKEVEATLRDVRAFLDDPVAVLERALELVRERSTAGEFPARH
jgi:hypothetical protein